MVLFMVVGYGGFGCLIVGVHRRWSYMCITDFLNLGEAVGGGDDK